MTSKPSKQLTLLIFHILAILSTPIIAKNEPIFACDTEKNPTLSTFNFCNTTAGVAERVEDLVKRLNLEEKIGFLINTGMNIERLGIPSYEWWNEGLHGVGGNGSWGTRFDDVIPAATSFPQVLLTAASFNTTLFEAIGKAISTEARAMHNYGLAGLNYFAPNINIYRDPRWGRGQETPGEDPVLTSAYAAAFVRGLQERDDGRKDLLKVAACCKHYNAYDIDNWNNTIRETFNAVVTKQDLEDTFKPPFRSCILDGNVASIMCSYNQINGKPSCADPQLEKVVRREWKLNGYIVSDYDAISEFYNRQHYTETPEKAAALALSAGVDLNVGHFLKDFTGGAIKLNQVNESVVDKAISNNFATLMRLGFFDGDPRKQFYGDLGPKNVCTVEHQELAREAARQGIVLLKNLKNTLPIAPSLMKSMAVIGPYANATDTMLGNYAGKACNFTSPLQGLSVIIPTTTYSPGCLSTCTDAQVNEAKKMAASADATILIMGDDISFGQEGHDRVDITLPGQQEAFITAIANASKGPTILVLMSGGSLDIQFAKDDANIESILWVGYPGEAGGGTIADVIYGFYNPSGRLPVSWYHRSYTERMPMTNMDMRPNLTENYPGRTYRFYNESLIFNFGFGLSYTSFIYYFVEDAPNRISIPIKSASSDSKKCEYLSRQIHFRVKNEGNLGGAETISFFLLPRNLKGAPKRQLLEFKKIYLEAGASEEMTFTVDGCKHLSLVDEHGERKITSGLYAVVIGNLAELFEVRVMTNEV